jgi:hypothetical protein
MPNRDRPLPAHMRPRFLSADQERLVREAWADGIPRDEVARLAGITIHVFEARRKDQLRDLPKRRQGLGGGRRGGDPTEEEILILTRRLQQRWSDEEREQAWRGSRRRDDPRD